MRLSDWHILTTGVVAYTKDDRISVLYKEGSLDWILKVDLVIYPLLQSPGTQHKHLSFSDQICPNIRWWNLRMSNFRSHWNSLQESPPECLPTREHHCCRQQHRRLLRVPRQPRESCRPDLHHSPGQAEPVPTVHLLVPEREDGQLRHRESRDGEPVHGPDGESADHPGGRSQGPRQLHLQPQQRQAGNRQHLRH